MATRIFLLPVAHLLGVVAATTNLRRQHSFLHVPSSAANATAIHQAMASGSTTHTVMENPSCQCETANAAWKRPVRTTPECVFIDLGAADGNTFNHFLANGYGPVSNCPSGGKYQAFLVEANPRFDSSLGTVEAAHKNVVHAYKSTAAFMCEATTSFYLDTVNHGNNYWGSSMSQNHPDAQRSGHTKVTVPTANILRLIVENTIPGDWVMLKMDIEGAEYDILPCLANAPEAAGLIDRLYLEKHPASWSSSGKTDADIEQAKQKLRAMKVDIPDYFSHTL